MNNNSASKIKLNSFSDLFGDCDNNNDETEKIIVASLTDLFPFHNHPFHVLDDEKMQETVESIRQFGILTPGIARPRASGGYEIISGHRRKYASELAGKTEMPIIVRNYSDEEATIIMVDSNIQREDILPSEKAKAYRMKYDALKHQGKKGEANTLNLVGDPAGDNAKMVQRYLWLSRLSDDLLSLVDSKKLGLSQGIDISFLDQEKQQWIYTVINELNCNISMLQSNQLKECGKRNELTFSMIHSILTNQRTKPRTITFKADKISQFFSDDYSSDEIEQIILGLLEEWKKQHYKEE